MAKVGKGRSTFINGVRYDEGAELPKDATYDDVITTDAEDAPAGNVPAAPAPVVTAKESKSSTKSAG